jgi:hypothetical protein
MKVRHRDPLSQGLPKASYREQPDRVWQPQQRTVVQRTVLCIMRSTLPGRQSTRTAATSTLKSPPQAVGLAARGRVAPAQVAEDLTLEGLATLI